MVYKFFDKKSQGKGLANNNENIQLANELHKPIIKKFNKIKVYSSSKDNIWGVDLADMQLLSKYLIRDLYFYYVLLIFLVNMPGLFL